MATSGTNNFSLSIDDLLDEAMLRLGGEAVLGNEAKTALRTLDLLFADLQNRGILLYKLEQTSVALTSATTSYTLASATIDVLDAALRRDGIDTKLQRLSFMEYLGIPDKDQVGRPSQYYIDRQRAAPILYAWPLTGEGDDSLQVWSVLKVEDAGALTNDPDAPRRFWPALVSGMAYYMAMKRPSIPLERVQVLKAMYEEELERAMEEDRERVSMRLVPKLRRC